MDLSNSDVKHLTRGRRRQRVAKPLLICFALKTVLLAGAGAWFFSKAEAADLLSQDLLRIQMYNHHFTAGLFCGFLALLEATLTCWVWSQRRSDALILKLLDRLSGYPSPN